METFNAFPRAAMALLEMSGFLAIILLGWLLMQVIQWENALHYGQAKWLRQIRVQARQLRSIRRTVEQAQSQDWSSLTLSPSMRKKWRWAGWILAALSAAPRARS